MCAAIAAGSPEGNAELCGAAPDARLYSCKTDYQLSSIIAAYEWIEDQLEQKDPPKIVVNNSFGHEGAAPPQHNGQSLPQDHPLALTIKRLVAAGIPMVFAAGNNHDEKQPRSIKPNTIWAWNSLPDVLTVAEVDENLRVRPYSSRGPGEWAPAQSPKPDCSAPTYGWVLFGDGYGDAAEGWGTSGASPQAAGLLAMLRQQRPDLKPQALYQRIRDKCRALSEHKYQVGCGLLDCDAALY